MSSNSKGTSARNFDRVIDLANPHAIPTSLFKALDSGLSVAQILDSTETAVDAKLWLYMHQPSVLDIVNGHSGSIDAPVSALEILNTLLNAPSEVPTVSLLDVFTAISKLVGCRGMETAAKAYKAALTYGSVLGLDDEGYLHIALSFAADYSREVARIHARLAIKHIENPGSLTVDENTLYTQLGNIDDAVKAAAESDDDLNDMREQVLEALGGLITTSALKSLASALAAAAAAAASAGTADTTPTSDAGAAPVPDATPAA